MIELTDKLRAVQQATREMAADLRARALSVDREPEAMTAHLDSPAFRNMQAAGTPVAYRKAIADPAFQATEGGSNLENVVAAVELARGDAGVMLACPGPALAGVVVENLGSEEQQEYFYRRLEDGRTWTFFAMTEPGRGNDATAMQARLESDGAGGYLLHGAKCYIGNGSRGRIGVVFARTGRSPLSIRAALVEPPAPGWSARPLDTIGLRGAYLSELEFDGVPVPRHMLLGDHLPATRRGMWGAIRTFNRMRIQVSALAIGTALAMHDYVAAHRAAAGRTAQAGLPAVRAQLEAARQLIFEAAVRVDHRPDGGYYSSAAKLGATQAAVRTARWAGTALGPGSLIEHPLLEKWTRDAFAFEIMEGTSNIQRLHVAQGYHAGEADAVV